MEERNAGIPWKAIFLGSVVVSFFCLAPGIIPLLGGVITLFAPTAILFYLAKLGWSYGLMAMGVAFIFSIVLYPHFAGGSIYYSLIEVFILGPVLFGFLRRKFSITKTVGYATGLLLLFLSVFLILWGIKTGQNPYQAVVSEINQSLDASLDFYEHLNVPKEALETMKEALHDIKSLAARFWPGFAAASLLVLVSINVWLGNRILHRYGIPGFQFGDLSRWSLPETVVWLLILAGGLVVWPYSGPRTVGINLLIFLTPAYFFQGLAIVSFYIKKYGLSRFMRLLLYSLICIQTYIIIMVAVVGLFDIWADFRRLKKAANETIHRRDE